MLQKGRSLHIGLNNVDTQAYELNGYEIPELSGCINDATAMQNLAAGQGFVTLQITEDQATAAEVIRLISGFSRELESGDVFFLTYSGHGGQVQDVNGYEADGLDETWILYDRMLIDDELYQLFRQFKPGVRIFMLSDSCHSGTVARMLITKRIIEQYRQLSQSLTGNNGSLGKGLDGFNTRDIKAYRSDPATMRDVRNLARSATVGKEIRFRGLPTHISRDFYEKRKTEYDTYQYLAGKTRDVGFEPSLIMISGCQDNQLSRDGDSNGLFTQNLLEAWNQGAFSGDYRKFFDTISANMPPEQTPNFYTIGDILEFSSQRPFTIVTQSFDPAGPPPSISVVGEPSRSRTDRAPDFTIDTQGAPFYVVEFATDLTLFDADSHDGDRTSDNFYATWSESPVFKASNGFYPMPNTVWDSLKAAEQIYFRVGTTTGEDGYPDYRVSIPNDADNAPSLVLV